MQADNQTRRTPVWVTVVITAILVLVLLAWVPLVGFIVAVAALARFIFARPSGKRVALSVLLLIAAWSFYVTFIKG